MILKVLFAFLLGLILGAIGTGFLVTSGAGNYLIAANPRVQELEAKIREAEDQRAFVTRRLEDVAHTTERMASRFEELSEKFATLDREQRDGGAVPRRNADPTPIATAAPPSDADGGAAATGD